MPTTQIKNFSGFFQVQKSNKIIKCILFGGFLITTCLAFRSQAIVRNNNESSINFAGFLHI